MGVKDLWNIISPLSDRRPLFELQGKAIAIDLSGWIVDSQSVTDNVAQPKMYLRNLFFRTVFLLMHEISPVFVLEGTAPSLKHKTIAKRNEIRNGPSEKKTNRKGGRGHLNRILKECEEMLKYMGITCVRGHGEAEAMCAYLNAEGLVEGCISQDSDCFLYGAKVVYRNFCTSTQGNRGTSSGCIDEYTIEKIERVFGLGRNKMVTLALLCGCDYDEGLNGVGKEAALKLFKVVNEDEILERIKSWRTDSRFEKMEAELANPNICTTCGHQGKMRAHVKSGCRDCGTLTKCNDAYKEKRVLMLNEISVRKKALLVENFPSQELINEFLYRKDPMPSSLDLKWKQPQIFKFVNFMERHVAWETEYAYAKILPLVTRWQVRHLAEIPDERRLSIPGLLIPERIKKPRNIKSVASYEIVWKDEKGLFEGMTLTSISDKENDFDDPQKPAELATLEPQHLFQKCYPLLVEEFENAKLAKKKKPVKPRAKKVKAVAEELGEKKEEKKKAQRRPRKPKVTENEKNRKIVEFIKTNQPTFEESFEAMTITPKRKKKNDDVTEAEIKRLIASGVKKRGPQFDKVKETERLDHILNGSLLRMFDELTPEDFPSDCDSEMDMSHIIEEICSNKPTNLSFKSNLCLDNEKVLGPHDSRRYEESFEAVKKPKVNLRSIEDLQKSIDALLGKSDSEESKCEFEFMSRSLQRLLIGQKDALPSKKSRPCLYRSPNVFVKKKKPKMKFDLNNFTYVPVEEDQKSCKDGSSEDGLWNSPKISDISQFKVSRPNFNFDRLDVDKCTFASLRFVQNAVENENEKGIRKPSVFDFTRLEMSEQNSCTDKLNFGDLSYERLRFDPKPLERQICEKSIRNSSIFNISEFILKDQEKNDQLDDVNSTFERLQIVPTFEIDCKNVENNTQEENEVKVGDSIEKSANVCKNAEENSQKINIFESVKLMIPEENEFTDESDLFDSTIEYSRDLQSPAMNSKDIQNSIRKSIINKSIKLSENNDSVDEFDLLISTHVPLNKRVIELQEPVRSSTPDYITAPQKKFSFGIDALLNDTDL